MKTPTPIERRQLLVGAGALLTAGAAWAAEPRRSLVDFSHVPLEPLIPDRAGAWKGAADPDIVPERVDGSIDHGRTLTRRYLAEGLAPVMLVVSYHGPQSPDLKVHRPETCYAVAGFDGAVPSMTAARITRSIRVPAVSFTARRGDRVETVLYWTRVGERFPQDLKSQRLGFLMEALHGVRADGLLVRASAVGADPQASLETLNTFTAALVAAAPPQGRTLLLGPDMARSV